MLLLFTIRKETYYRTTGLTDVYNSCVNFIRKEVADKEMNLTSDFWSSPSVGISLLVITCLYFNNKWQRQNRILVIKAVKKRKT